MSQRDAQDAIHPAGASPHDRTPGRDARNTRPALTAHRDLPREAGGVRFMFSRINELIQTTPSMSFEMKSLIDRENRTLRFTYEQYSDICRSSASATPSKRE